LQDASDNTVALLEAFAGGAVLTMLTDTMIPEAYKERRTRAGAAHRPRLRPGLPALNVE
jgi:zinc transporter ZupT